jgi:hypothetical protein
MAIVPSIALSVVNGVACMNGTLAKVTRFIISANPGVTPSVVFDVLRKHGIINDKAYLGDIVNVPLLVALEVKPVLVDTVEETFH